MSYPLLADEQMNKLRSRYKTVIDRACCELTAADLRARLAAMIPAYEKEIARVKREEHKENRRLGNSRSRIYLSSATTERTLAEMRGWLAALKFVKDNERFLLDHEDVCFFNLAALPTQLEKPRRIDDYSFVFDMFSDAAYKVKGKSNRLRRLLQLVIALGRAGR